MKTTALVACTLSLALAGCFGPGDPVEIPEDITKAAQTCFAAQSLALRADAGDDEPVTFSQYSETIQYPLIAAAKVEPFTVQTALTALESLEPVMDKVAALDYEGAVPKCEARFGISGAEGDPTLPESDAQAVMSCLAMAGFMAGGVREEGENFAEKVGIYEALVARLSERMKTDVDILTAMIDGDGEALVNEGLKQAFAEGDPEGYLAKCEARFPAK